MRRDILTELCVKLVQIGQLGQRGCGVGEAARTVSLKALGAVPTQVRTGPAQAALEAAQLFGQPGVAQRVGHEPGELAALVGGE